MYTTDEIANFFIEKGLSENNPVNPMKLQKLLYYAYGWYYGMKNEPLFDEKIQAWRYGPVIKSIYHKVKAYGNYPITTPIYNTNIIGLSTSIPRICDDNTYIKEYLETIWYGFSKYSAIELANLTHEVGAPWDTTIKNNDSNMDVIISDDIIKEYFTDKIKEYKI